MGQGDGRDDRLGDGTAGGGVMALGSMSVADVEEFWGRTEYEYAYRTQLARRSTKAELVIDINTWEDEAADCRRPWAQRLLDKRLAAIARTELHRRIAEGEL